MDAFHRIGVLDPGHLVDADETEQLSDDRHDQYLPLCHVPGLEVGAVVATPLARVDGHRMNGAVINWHDLPDRDDAAQEPLAVDDHGASGAIGYAGSHDLLKCRHVGFPVVTHVDDSRVRVVG